MVLNRHTHTHFVFLTILVGIQSSAGLNFLISADFDIKFNRKKNNIMYIMYTCKQTFN